MDNREREERDRRALAESEFDQLVAALRADIDILRDTLWCSEKKQPKDRFDWVMHNALRLAVAVASSSRAEFRVTEDTLDEGE